MPEAGDRSVRAAGGAVWRRADEGGQDDDDIEVVLVHRPRYDDWSLPKGKVDGDESDEAAALREVEEETGLSCQLGPELLSTSYLDKERRPKTVRYWAMTVVSGSVAGHHEVDDAGWFRLAAAKRKLSYARDAEVLGALVRCLPAEGG